MVGRVWSFTIVSQFRENFIRLKILRISLQGNKCPKKGDLNGSFFRKYNFFQDEILSRNFFEDLNRETKWSKSVNWTENYAKINTCETQFPSPLEITFKKKINQLKLAKYE